MIRLRGIRKVYADGHEALSGVDLDIDDGMLGVLGPNGAGKTTLLSILVLAREPSGGSRVYDGLDAANAGDRREIRRRIGFLPQDFEPIPWLTGLEYVLHCARLRDVPLRNRELQRRVTELLDAVGLSHALHRRAGEYSGGMRRRLGIAQALVHAPRLLVVDEPTAGLDPEERIRFRNLVTDVADGETAVLLSTHIVEDIEATCARLIIVARGRALFDGPPGELLHRAVGRLFAIAEADRPPELPIVGRRIAPGGRSIAIVLADGRPAAGTPHEPTLEEAYGAFLAERHAGEESRA